MSEPSTLRDVRDKRRAERLSGRTRPDYMTVIVEAAERVLAETPFHKITIDQILSEAQVSRATFYAYFSSKGEVVAEVLGRVMLELFDLLDPLFQRLPDDSRREAIAAVLQESAKLWKLHRPVFHATHENWHSVPELRVKWLALVEKFTDAIAEQLERGAKHGAAAAGKARQRSAALLWSSEQLFYLAGTDADDDLDNEQDLLETLAIMWEGTLFGLR
jgi:TetR/AcrR family transcriptional regulator, ethionamide resistance regulator